jgi:hypothetical protein
MEVVASMSWNGTSSRFEAESREESRVRDSEEEIEAGADLRGRGVEQN